MYYVVAMVIALTEKNEPNSRTQLGEHVYVYFFCEQIKYANLDELASVNCADISKLFHHCIHCYTAEIATLPDCRRNWL